MGGGDAFKINTNLLKKSKSWILKNTHYLNIFSLYYNMYLNICHIYFPSCHKDIQYTPTTGHTISHSLSAENPVSANSSVKGALGKFLSNIDL